ncbi:MAG: hypothetical protein EBR82_60925 [Caulobacteraceae bacterium]|nr:hypothetical protein [Caulobacteraceae bacterium]
MITTDYKSIREAYKEVKDSEDISKSRQFYTSVDTATGSYKDASLLAGRITNDLQRLDMRGELCGSFEVRLKHNDHDFGGYYSVDIYNVDLEVEEDSDLYDIVDIYLYAGYKQLEDIVKNYAV